MKLDADRIVEFLKDPFEDGVLRWAKQIGCRCVIDEVAGYLHIVRCEPRWTIQLAGRKYLRSHLVFALYNQRWPDKELVLDHIDKNTLNDSIYNLREVTQSKNIETREPFRYWKQGLRA